MRGPHRAAVKPAGCPPRRPGRLIHGCYMLQAICRTHLHDAGLPRAAEGRSGTSPVGGSPSGNLRRERFVSQSRRRPGDPRGGRAALGTHLAETLGVGLSRVRAPLFPGSQPYQTS